MSRVDGLGKALAMAVWICWATVVAVVFVLLIVFELIEAGLAFGSAQYTGKADDRSMALVMIPAMMAVVAALGHATVVWPALRRRRSRHGRTAARDRAG